MDLIDQFLARRTTPRFVLVGLFTLAIISIVEAFFGLLPFTALELLVSLVLLLGTTGITNRACALLIDAKASFESSYITAFLLFFILAPIQSGQDAAILMAAGAFAALSKYVFSINKIHIFNPAVFAALVISWLVPGMSLWWVATPLLFPFVLVLGLFVLRKLRRYEMVSAFFVSVLVIAALLAVASHIFSNTIPALVAVILSTPIIFFATLLLTDPQTSPDTRKSRNTYGIIVGVLYAFSLSVPLNLSGGFFTTYVGHSAIPLIALLVGNIYAYVHSYTIAKRNRFALLLQRTQDLSKDIREYSFLAQPAIHFRAGHYIELTLPHKSPDTRGVRRAFSITSAPSDPILKITTTLEVEGSTFKDALRDLEKNAQGLTAIGPRGHFTFPRDPSQKILCVASGIGIAPFMSFFRELASRRERRDLVLIYSATSPLDFVYRDEMESIQDSIGLRIIYLPLDFMELSRWDGPSGLLTQKLITKEVRDYAERCWFIAGPQQVVESYAYIARDLGIPKKNLKIEPFPGF